MDVHQVSISAAVRDNTGKLVMECVLETKAVTILEFIQGLRGSLCVTFEEGTSVDTAWRARRPAKSPRRKSLNRHLRVRSLPAVARH